MTHHNGINLPALVEYVKTYCRWQDYMEELRANFKALARQWKKETRHLSSATEIAMNMNYQRIIGMGPHAIPFILEELQREPDHWFHALRVLTGENPVKPEDAGNMQAMADAWIEWGRKEGLV